MREQTNLPEDGAGNEVSYDELFEDPPLGPMSLTKSAASSGAGSLKTPLTIKRSTTSRAFGITWMRPRQSWAKEAGTGKG